jgi:uncharacterized protein (DUF362 family)
MQLDVEHFNTPEWNPLGGLIHPGDMVVLKPNLVLDHHECGGDIQSVITHGSLVRAVLDYVCIALRRRGKIIIGDAPLQITNFGRVAWLSGLDGVVNFFKAQEVDIELIDFRQSQSSRASDDIIDRRWSLGGDPRGSTVVDLADKSWLMPLASGYERYRVTCYDPAEMRKHHNLTTNEYLIANSVLQADVIINLPKMKTHRKVGVTSALKNLVGINAYKDWLPHHRRGSVSEGGDEYYHADALKAAWSQLIDYENAAQGWASRRAYSYTRRLIGRLVRRFQRDPFSEGSWYGNDTAWRMVLDLNHILLYASKDGAMQDSLQRKVFNMVDGIIAGEAEGPLEPTPRPMGVLVAGCNSVAVDAVVARLMGFDYRKIPLIREGFNAERGPLVLFSPDDIEVVSNVERWSHLDLMDGRESLRFEPPAGWKGHIELDAEISTL